MSDEVGLDVLHLLQKVAQLLKANEGGLSKTKILRTLDADNDCLMCALQHGYDNGYIEWEMGNWIKYKKDYTIPEESFYPTVKTAIEELWKREGAEFIQFFMEKTARADSKISGPWTRPDFTLICHKKFAWTIGEEFDVVTFEVKRPDSCNVLAVFEALAHSSNATRAYVVFPIDQEAWHEIDPEQEARVKDECSKHGVGLILIEEIDRNYRAKQVIKARKNEIDHERVSKFLSAVMTPSGKERIASWKR